MPVKTRPTSAAAPPSTHQPSLRRRSHMADASVVMKQPTKARIAVGTCTYIRRTESFWATSAGLQTRA